MTYDIALDAALAGELTREQLRQYNRYQPGFVIQMLRIINVLLMYGKNEIGVESWWLCGRHKRSLVQEYGGKQWSGRRFKGGIRLCSWNAPIARGFQIWTTLLFRKKQNQTLYLKDNSPWPGLSSPTSWENTSKLARRTDRWQILRWKIKINDERGVYMMIAFMKVKVNNERSRIIATNRQRTKDNRMET